MYALARYGFVQGLAFTFTGGAGVGFHGVALVMAARALPVPLQALHGAGYRLVWHGIQGASICPLPLQARHGSRLPPIIPLT